jgi:hypothetical protein
MTLEVNQYEKGGVAHNCTTHNQDWHEAGNHPARVNYTGKEPGVELYSWRHEHKHRMLWLATMVDGLPVQRLRHDTRIDFDNGF